MPNPTYDRMKKKIEDAKNFIIEKKVLMENNFLPLDEKSKIYIKNYLDEIWKILNA